MIKSSTLRPALALLAASALTLTANAVIAKRDVRTVTQPDGTTIRIKVTGDEFMHFTTAEDGTLLHEDANGLYTFGRVDDNGMVVSTGIRFAENKAVAEKVNISDIDLNVISEKRAAEALRTGRPLRTPAAGQRDGMRRAPQTGLGLAHDTYPRFGSPKGLIILVQYSDVSFQTPNAVDYFHDMINGENFTQYNGTGSALEYFTEQSRGQFTPQFDVLGPVTLPNPQSYYGGNDSYGNDMHPEDMVIHAINILNPTVDFSVYDTDKDGEIDNVYIFYAGQGEADYGSANTVWPHQWDISWKRQRVDGVLIGKYACSNEWGRNKPEGIGTFVHEFSHVMGLPDLYHTASSNASYTPGFYSVLDYGPYSNDGRTPPNYGAYEKNAMGWEEPIMLDGPASVTLDNISSGQFGLIPTSKNSEFYLLENRQLTGWDKYLPNHGMLIWHIDYVKSVFQNNVVNNTQNHQYVDLIEAGNQRNSYNTTIAKSYPFPGTSKKTEFTSTTSPALVEWNGTPINLPVTGITESNGLISFDVAGGAIKIESPVGTPYTPGAYDNYFIAQWSAVEGATDYYLTVVAQNENATGSVKTGFDNSAVPAGWDASSTDFYTATAYYGESAPSFKFGTNGQTLTSPIIPGRITKVQFWMKGITCNSTYLITEAYCNGAWTQVDRHLAVINKEETIVFEDIPETATQIRFKMEKVLGNIALDDVVIEYKGIEEVLPAYNELSTKGALWYRVENLPKDITKYYFTVKATDGTSTSASSAPVYIDFGGKSGVEDIVTDPSEDNAAMPVEYFNLQGVRVENPAPGSLVIRRQGTEVSKILVK